MVTAALASIIQYCPLYTVYSTVLYCIILSSTREKRILYNHEILFMPIRLFFFMIARKKNIWPYKNAKIWHEKTEFMTMRKLSIWPWEDCLYYITMRRLSIVYDHEKTVYMSMRRLSMWPWEDCLYSLWPWEDYPYCIVYDHEKTVYIVYDHEKTVCIVYCMTMRRLSV